MASPSESDTQLLSNSQQPQSETNLERTCDICAEQKRHSLATEWCNDCRESLCIMCKEYHKRYKSTHTIIDLQQLEAELILSPSEIRTSVPLVCSIYIMDEEDSHIIACEWKHVYYEITEYMGEKEVSYCKLEMNKKNYFPDDITSVSSNTLVVACGWNKSLCYLEHVPTLKLVKVVRTKNEYYSISFANDRIYACDKYFGVDLLKINGDRLQTIKAPQLDLHRLALYYFGYILSPSQYSYYHRIRANPSARIIWMLNKKEKRIFCFSDKGNLIKSFDSIDQEEIEDIGVNENGLLYYSNRNGVFSLARQEQIYRFPKTSECDSRIYIIRNKIFVSVKIYGEMLIKCIEI